MTGGIDWNGWLYRGGYDRTKKIASLRCALFSHIRVYIHGCRSYICLAALHILVHMRHTKFLSLLINVDSLLGDTLDKFRG